MANTTRHASPPATRNARPANGAAKPDDGWEDVPVEERSSYSDGLWWRPSEGEVLECVVKDTREGKYGPYYVAVKEGGEGVMFNAHAAIGALPADVWLRIEYLGRDENGRRHVYHVRQNPNKPVPDDDIPF